MIPRVAFFLVFLSFISICESVNISLWEDGACMDPPPKPIHMKNQTSSTDDKKKKKDDVWYTTMQSRYDLYLIGSLISGIPIDALNDEDIKRSCITYTISGELFEMHGFQGKSLPTIVDPPGPTGGIKWKVKGDTKSRGEFWIMYSSDEYLFTVTCWANGHRSFAVDTKTRYLDDHFRKIVLEKLEDLGFNSKNFYYNNYGGCE